MRQTDSSHTESLRALPFHHDLAQKSIFRPALNLSELTHLLKEIPISNATTVEPVGKGKKRALSPNAVVAEPKSKKRAQVRVKTEYEDNVFMHYPRVISNDQPDTTASIPAFSHTFEIDYNKSVPPGPMPGHFITDEDDSEWIAEEKCLQDTLALLGGPFSEPRDFDLGAIGVGYYRGRSVVFSDVLRKRDGNTNWLLLLPVLPDELDFEALGVPPYERRHGILSDCHALEENGRVAVTGRLILVMLPLSEPFPFRLRVQVTVSLIAPAIYEPVGVGRSAPLEISQRRLVQFVYPDPILVSDGETTSIPFFYSVVCPAPHILDDAVDAALQPDALVAKLLPFQRRSVSWLLGKEDKIVQADGQIVPKPENSANFSFWERIEDGLVLNRLTGNLAATAPDEDVVLGAMLAEEPGLGKTVETIALILLNPAPPDRHPGVTRWDPEAAIEVKAVKATLIVTPPSLATQWVDEFKVHAPSLKVLVYEGWNKVGVPITATETEKQRAKQVKSRGKGKAKRKGKGKKKDEDDSDSGDEDEAEVQDWCSYVQQFDVVITTYSALKSDLNVARAAPKRPRREDVVYSNVERPRSPLILAEWNRVVMDEVQMAGGGNCEEMVSLIPRRASLSVSATPAKTQILDLKHVLKFLRIEHIVGAPRHWIRLCSPGYSAHFTNFFQSIAIRTTKANVTAELTIPQQTRYLVPIEMGPVERHVYDQSLEMILLELGPDARGVDVRGENREPDGTLLRSLLRKLRAICTHPQVGQIGNKLFKPGGLKTMEQVLQTMCDDNWSTVVEQSRLKIQGLVRMSQLQQQLGQDKQRYQHSLETLLLAEKDTVKLLDEIETCLANHEASRQEQATDAAEDAGVVSDEKGKGKERERERSLSPLSDIESEDDEKDTPADKQYRAKRNGLKHRLRELQIVMHRLKFLMGDVYHMLKSPKENEAYEEAETIRRNLLKTTEQTALSAMEQLTSDPTSNQLTLDELLIETPFLEYEFKDDKPDSAGLQDEVNDIIELVLNQQTALLWEWRARMRELLSRKLTPGEGDADGQEYQRTLDDQGEAETYLANYSYLLADRREALLQERTTLAKHDAREKKLRHTKAAIKAAAALDKPADPLKSQTAMQPEHEVLHKELSVQRKHLLEQLDGRAVKSVIFDMGTRAARIHKETDPLKLTLKDAVGDLRRLVTDQGSLLGKLEEDLVLIRKAFNQRVNYFRQLQEISDSVADVDFETTAAEALQECATEQRQLAAKINMHRARQRYLDHLSKNRTNTADEDEDDRVCILCKCDFIRGFITQCAHVFCEDCTTAWLGKKSKTCPVCRVPIEDLERFTVAEKPVEVPAVAPMDVDSVPKSRRQIEYNMIDAKMLREIQDTPSFGDHGNKIQTLVRHLLYLRTVDGGAKSIIFSAWAESLFIVEQALRENGIPCLRIDQNRKGMPAVKRFAASEDIDVLLLHGERENAGLNITVAKRVFLLESVVAHGFELQAIARIDRMGQKKSTEVFCYYAEDTVEKNILDLAARRGTSIYTKSNCVGAILNATALDGDKKMVDSPAKRVQKGDFIFKYDDMMAILFPHLFEDVEYLLPAEDVAMPDVPSTSSGSVNAVAGPSRLR
ncbi:SNF2 family N-terminal domain-containing protein [Roridomyces roridus]|uniref:SNF2 family N-terminal domain-containing protein n=1 Tax=Roridomyces roridus TaxID=1738132 RepID=A0AAD7BJW1_9AGAR|nr:SNF2 family N-terminal domain-containing protein [Roridomyces roridus]